MKYSKKRLTLLARLAFVGGVFFVLFVIGYYAGYLRENCEQDVACFDERAQQCRPSDVVVSKDNNVYQYMVGSSVGDCHVQVTLQKVEAGAPVEFQNLEGKKMTCAIPKSELDGFSVGGFDKYMTYCHGLLKEGLYEIILTRVYSNIIGQMSDVLQAAQQAVGKK